MKYDDRQAGMPAGMAGYIAHAVAVLILLAAHSGLAQGLNLLGESGGGDNDPESPINRKINLDLMYGTDDFFGEDTDLSYADRVTPSGKTVETPAADSITLVGGTDRDKDKGKDKDRKKDDTGDSGDTGDTGDPGDPGGGDDPPPPPPPPPPDPECPD